MLKNHFKRRNQEDVWKNISDYKDCANQDNEITVPPTAYSILVLFYIFFPINIEQVFQLFFFPPNGISWHWNKHTGSKFQSV